MICIHTWQCSQLHSDIFVLITVCVWGARFLFPKVMYKIYVQLVFFVGPVFKVYLVILVELE